MLIKKKDTDIENHTETTQNSTETSTEIADASISAKISAVERDIRRLIGEDPHITIDQMVEKTNWSKGGIRYQIDKMKKAGKLSREGSQKDGKWVIKYTILLFIGDMIMDEEIREEIVTEEKDTIYEIPLWRKI